MKIQKALFVLTWFLGALVCVKALSVRLYNTDLWWHLAAGRAMVQTRSFLRTDIFSHTMHGTPWINFEWLGQLVLYGIHALSGFWGLYAIKIIVCLSVVILLVLIARRAGATGPVLFLVSWLGFKVVESRLQDRLELFTFVFLEILVWLVLWARKENETIHKWLPWAIFGLMVVWVNSHGGFVYGVGFLVLLTAGAVWAKEPGWYQKLLLKMSIAATGALIFNPDGTGLGVLFWELFHQTKNISLIAEWKASNVIELPHFWVLYLASAAVIAVGLLKQWREVRFWTPLVVLFAIWGSFYYRNAALLAFAAVPLLASMVRVKRAARFLWVVALLVVLSDVRILAWPLPHTPVMWNRFPVKACDYVRDNDIRGRMFNSYDTGGYIMWSLGPERSVFMDGRYIFYPLLVRSYELSDEVQTAGVDDNQWARFLNDHGVDHAIVSYPDHYFRYAGGKWPFRFSLLNVMFPRESWALVFWDDAGLVFLKRTPGFKRIIERDEYKALWPYNMEQMSFLLGNGLLKKTAAQAELVRHRQYPGPTMHGQEIENLLEITASRPQ